MKKDDLRARLLATFRAEAQEHLEAITKNLEALERGLPDEQAAGAVEDTFRAMHTLKGAARSVSLMEVESLCQAGESLLSRVTRGEATITRSILSGLQDTVAGVARVLAEGREAVPVRDLIGRLGTARGVEAPEPAPPPRRPSAGPARAAGAGPPPADTIRVATVMLDALLVEAEELLVPKLAAGERVREARGLLEALARCRRTLDGAARARRSNGDSLSDLDAALRTAEAQARELLGRLFRDQRAITATVDGLQSEARRLRMSPASTVLDLFPAMVRDLAGAKGKQAEWTAHRADLELDRKVLEAMKDPLIHLVRNAVDHGLEPAEDRSRAGKPPRGRIAVALALLEGGRVEIRLDDDGRGIDPERVKGAAVRSRFLTAEQAGRLTDQEALDLVYRSGVSTSPMITEVSGHGLGLAIARERVERLGGQIRIETRLGAGTAVRMILPATIATFRGLLVRAGGQLFLLPTEAVERAIRIGSDDVRPLEGRDTIFREGRPLSLARLSDLLGLPGREPPSESRSRHPCVIVACGGERMGLRVDEILGDREVVVKELRPPLLRVRNVAGAGLLATGELALILRPADLVRSARETARPAPPAAETKEAAGPARILVVDDSITTRTMEKNLLETAGYSVRVAVDGMEAWTTLKTEAFDLVVSDVDMPRMDGFELTSRIRGDETLADLPVVLVTALESREHKERGIEVGANAYVVKSSFDQSNLIEIIRRLA